MAASLETQQISNTNMYCKNVPSSSSPNFDSHLNLYVNIRFVYLKDCESVFLIAPSWTAAWEILTVEEDEDSTLLLLHFDLCIPS